MSIEVRDIVKLYGQQRALSGVSFSISRGEVVGFLGPNGAGKSTMMKILTGYIPPTSGNASVCGFDVIRQSIDARRQIGYLPEHNPLYTDMYVREYLAFIAGMYGVSRPRQRAEQMIERVGLGREAHKKIEALSKGYRQRVGLAQAMIHDPQVLILDEPTSGLDPNQLAEIRSLILDIGAERTVMLSTHIMQEVEAICSRTIIVHLGQIVADEPTGQLRSGKRGAGYELFAEFSGPVRKESLLSIEGVAKVEGSGTNGWIITVDAERDIRKEVSDLAVREGHSVLTLSRREQKLEVIFKELTRSAGTTS